MFLMCVNFGQALYIKYIVYVYKMKQVNCGQWKTYTYILYIRERLLLLQHHHHHLLLLMCNREHQESVRKKKRWSLSLSPPISFYCHSSVYNMWETRRWYTAMRAFFHYIVYLKKLSFTEACISYFDLQLPEAAVRKKKKKNCTSQARLSILQRKIICEIKKNNNDNNDDEKIHTYTYIHTSMADEK